MCTGTSSLDHVIAIKISDTEIIITDATYDCFKEVWTRKKKENPAITAHEICHILGHSGLSAVVRPFIDETKLL
ncbi:hypothetical protein BR63_10315 [Thermanaerosceptrum fracticalcis]|uniref:Uncharacterized protein n=1 Tax=Thermanaerosceptrum fracticalcis TaxID=1712410 RepID=A0A7G6E3K9_THEFR|nr:hypothetical protein [Thermanaerosceptrum fracticalcis]QNB46663.1 hypothetical protein BR63_10315 [Thermanaerosceptrum fracticalcis]